MTEAAPEASAAAPDETAVAPVVSAAAPDETVAAPDDMLAAPDDGGLVVDHSAENSVCILTQGPRVPHGLQCSWT